MTKALYIALTLFVACILQILVGNYGFIATFLPLLVFYHTVVFGWKEGIIYGFISGVVLDVLYGRTYFISPFVNLFAVIFAIIWLHNGELKSLSLQVFPASLTSITNILLIFLIVPSPHEWGFIFILKNIIKAIFEVFLSYLIFIFIIIYLDKVSLRLGFYQYKTAQKRLTE